MTNYLEDAFLRVMAMQRECITDTAGAVPYFFHTQETFPYWTNRIVTDLSEFYTEDFKRHSYTLIMRFIVGHLTEGQPGTPDARLYADLATINAYFDGHIGLTSAAYPTFPDHLDAKNVEYTGAERIGTFDNRSIGLPTLQVGAEFHLILPFTLQITYPAWR